MKVIFNSVSIEGFLSVGEATINFNNRGMVYVQGRNESPGNQESNGSGKSTIFEAIIYALTGSTLRGAKDVVNRYYPKGYCQVSLDLTVDEVNYIVTRTRNHPTSGNNLFIIKNGEDISGGKLRRSESILEQEIGTLTTAFISNVIILGQGLPNKFTNLGPMDRRNRLEEYSQSSEFISEIKTRISNYADQCKSKLSDERIKQSKFDTVISMSENQIRSCSDEINTINEKTKDTKDYSDLIEELESKSKEVEESMKTYQSNRNIFMEKVKEYQNKLSRCNSDILAGNRSFSKLASDYNTLQTSKCPTCGQYITSPDSVNALKESLSSQMDQIKLSLEEYERDKLSCENAINVLNTKLNHYESLYQESSNSYMTIREKLTEIKAEEKFDKDKINDLMKNIEACRLEIDQASRELESITKEVSNLDLKIEISSFLDKKVSKEFRNHLLIGVVDFLNKKLSYYSNILFGTSELKMELTESQIYISYSGRQYENLSGGERQRADLAVQFSLRDMLISTLGFNCNLLVIDEGFDNLDSTGVESLIKVINEMDFIESIFVISHHTLSIPFDSVLTVNKGLDNISYVEDNNVSIS